MKMKTRLAEEKDEEEEESERVKSVCFLLLFYEFI